MNKTKERLLLLLSRYLFAIASVLALPLAYLLLRPLTIFPVYVILSLFYKTSLQGSIMAIGPVSIQFIDACIAGTAYVLLLILNLLTPMKLKKRILIIFIDFALLLVFNIARLIILIIMLVNGSTAFDVTHQAFWLALSTIFVALIWLFNIFIFKIKEIPIYSDIKEILILSRKEK